MTLKVYYPDDIRRALLAAGWAGETTAQAGTVSPDYMDGYRAALETIAIAFGLGDVQPVVPVVGNRYQSPWPVRVLGIGPKAT